MTAKQIGIRKLIESLQSIEKARFFVGFNHYVFVIDCQNVTFRTQLLVRYSHKDDCVRQVFVFEFFLNDYIHFLGERARETLLQKLYGRHFFHALIDIESCSAVHDKSLAVRNFHNRRLRNHIHLLTYCDKAYKHCHQHYIYSFLHFLLFFFLRAKIQQRFEFSFFTSAVFLFYFGCWFLYFGC